MIIKNETEGLFSVDGVNYPKDGYTACYSTDFIILRSRNDVRDKIDQAIYTEVIVNSNTYNTAKETVDAINTMIGSPIGVLRTDIINNSSSIINLSSQTLKKDQNLSDILDRQSSLNNLTDVSSATNESVLTKDTATGNAIFKGLNGVPTGSILIWSSANIPTGYLECDGSELSRVAYEKLFNVIGETYGVGDGTTTFNIPELRGEFIRGLDHGRAVDPNRELASFQEDEFKAHNHAGVVGGNAVNLAYGNQIAPIGNSATGTTGGAETRPRNIALPFIIKY